MKRFWLAGFACAATLSQAAEPLTAERFEWRQTIQVETPGEAIYRFELPEAAHAGSRRRDLGDLRIFNGAGEVVPHAFVNYEAPARQDIAQTPAAFFPLRQDGKKGEGALSVAVRQTTGGTLVSTQLGPAKADGARLAGYVVDASAIERTRRALLLDWQPQAEGTVLPVRVEASDDLQSWRQIVAAAQLVDLRSNESQLRQKRIDLAGSAAKYFRIRWPDDREGIVLTSLAVETSAQAERPERRQWTAARDIRPGGAPGEFLFASAGLPVEAIRLGLPEANTIVPLRIQHRRDEREPWREAASTVAYRLLRGGEELRSAPIFLCCSGDRHWRILFDQRGGGIGARPPTVDLGWTPQQGLFVARGAGPFLLAYGNADVAPTGFTPAALVPDYKPERYPGLAAATFAAPVGAAATADPAATQAGPNWRTIGLWSVLIAGVLLLGAMVWRLLRQMGDQR